MDEFNAVSRGVYIADNLELLRALNDACVDLVCIDPPFAKNETFGKKNNKARDPLKPPLSQAEKDNELRLLAEWGIRNPRDAERAKIVWPETAYKDIWSWEKDIHESWVESLEQYYPAVGKVIDATRYTHSEGTAAYLCFMALRLIEIHRVLKATGSLYLHCDHTTNSYLRLLVDAVFGKDNFRNDIIWSYQRWTGATQTFQRMHDTIFFYAKSEGATFNQLTEAYSVKSQHRGRRHSTFDGSGKIQQVYTEDSSQQEAMRDVWEISYLNSQARERVGYPTQKPVELAERVIASSSNPGDVVLDCFAGCAYTAVAAERLGRRWVACDLNPRAWTVFKRQFNKPSLALLTCDDQTSGQQVMADNPVVTIHGPGQLPARTSPVREDEPKAFQLPERKFKVPASIIPEAEMLVELLKLSDYKAWCCGFANRRPDGAIVETTRNFHLDHIAPKSRENTGTSNNIQNRAPLCPYHNIRKNNRRVGLAEYRQEIADAGELMVNTLGDLINLDWAQEQAMQIYGRAFARRNPPGG